MLANLRTVDSAIERTTERCNTLNLRYELTNVGIQEVNREKKLLDKLTGLRYQIVSGELKPGVPKQPKKSK